MRIWSKCRFRFVGSKPEDYFETRPKDFQEVPDWITETRLYQLALSDGSITELASGKSEAQAVDESNTKQRETRGKREEKAAQKAAEIVAPTTTDAE